jgi:hypothetical protein
MSSSSVNRPVPAARAPQPAKPAPGPAPSRQDVEAMNDAFAAVRKRQGAGQGAPLTAKDAREKQASNGPPLQRPGVERWQDRFAQERDLARQNDQENGLNAFGQAAGPVPVPVAAPATPSPLVDPSAFVQLMAQLWARENGKGARDVRVQFGDSAWPATGARLVRNAAGTLDIELHLGDRSAPDERMLDDLRGAFADQGLELAALSTTNDPIA